MLLLQYHTFQQGKAMPKFCIAANCSTTSGDCYSLQEFPQDKALHAKWVQCYQSKWDGPSSSSVLCSKNFKQDCFVGEGICFHESMGIPANRGITITPFLQYLACLPMVRAASPAPHAREQLTKSVNEQQQVQYVIINNYYIISDSR